MQCRQLEPENRAYVQHAVQAAAAALHAGYAQFSIVDAARLSQLDSQIVRQVLAMGIWHVALDVKRLENQSVCHVTPCKLLTDAAVGRAGAGQGVHDVLGARVGHMGDGGGAEGS